MPNAISYSWNEIEGTSTSLWEERRATNIIVLLLFDLETQNWQIKKIETLKDPTHAIL